ncbi:unnamed protein product, partial [Schistosoma turkestanicum]
STTLKGSACNNETNLSTDPSTLNEPVKTVKELIAFYYYWKRKSTSACSSSSSSSSVSISGVGSGGGGGGVGGGLSSVAENFATAVVAAALNTDTTTNNNCTTTSTTATATPSSLVGNGSHTTPFESANNLNGSAFSTQAHITSVSVKKRKPTNRGCV